jgi:hypothetical protein
MGSQIVRSFFLYHQILTHSRPTGLPLGSKRVKSWSIPFNAEAALPSCYGAWAWDIFILIEKPRKNTVNEQAVIAFPPPPKKIKWKKEEKRPLKMA